MDTEQTAQPTAATLATAPASQPQGVELVDHSGVRLLLSVLAATISARLTSTETVETVLAGIQAWGSAHDRAGAAAEAHQWAARLVNYEGKTTTRDAIDCVLVRAAIGRPLLDSITESVRDDVRVELEEEVRDEIREELAEEFRGEIRDEVDNAAAEIGDLRDSLRRIQEQVEEIGGSL